MDRGFYIIRYDSRDTGKSTCHPPDESGYTFEDLVDSAVVVLDAYEIDKTIIMGMSMSGMLTQMIAPRHPQRASGIVLLSSMYFANGAESLPYSSGEVDAFLEQMTKSEPPKDTDGLVEVTIQQ